MIQVQDNLDPSQSITYRFDANGNQTSKTQAGVTTAFVYDVRDHLRQVTQGGSTVGQFLYDYRGLRVEKQGARGTERYSYDDTSVLTQFDASGATLAKYEYGGDRLLSLNHFGDGVQFYHFDALGSPVTLTKPDGTTQARYAYDAWGHVRHQSGSSWNRFGFTGHEHDQETGLIYAKARYYDPDTGRFLSHDPWEGDITLAPSLHKYLYAYMNPTVYIDPDGREAYPLFNVPVNPETDVVDPIRVVDTGNVIADNLLAFIASAPNAGYMFVNAVSNGATLPVQAFAGARGQSLEKTEAEIMATIASTGPAAPILQAGTLPFRAPLLLNRLSRSRNALSETRVVRESIDAPGSVVSMDLDLPTSSPGVHNLSTQERSLEIPLKRSEATAPQRHPRSTSLTPTQKKVIQQKIESRTATQQEWEMLDSDRRFDNRRKRGVDRFWSEERKRLKSGEEGTRNWSSEQKDVILGTTRKRPQHDGKSIEGHHRYNAQDYPQIADDPNNIYPATEAEHLYRWHGGNYQNETSGKPLNPLFDEEF